MTQTWCNPFVAKTYIIRSRKILLSCSSSACSWWLLEFYDTWYKPFYCILCLHDLSNLPENLSLECEIIHQKIVVSSATKPDEINYVISQRKCAIKPFFYIDADFMFLNNVNIKFFLHNEKEMILLMWKTSNRGLS